MELLFLFVPIIYVLFFILSCKENKYLKKHEEDEDNLMGVFEAMRLLEDNYLGGSGSRGFGKVKFTNISITKRGQDYYKKDVDEEVIIENADISEAVKSIN